MEYYLGFIAGILAALAISLAIIKYKEVKQGKEAARPDDKPVKFTVNNIRPVPITVEHIFTDKEMMLLQREVIEGKISRKLAEEVMKYADTISEENRMDCTVKIRARVWVVENWGGFR